jgi:hypothetical protein
MSPFERVLAAFEADVGVKYDQAQRTLAAFEWGKLPVSDVAFVNSLTDEQLDELCNADPEERPYISDELHAALEEIFEIIGS